MSHNPQLPKFWWANPFSNNFWDIIFDWHPLPTLFDLPASEEPEEPKPTATDDPYAGVQAQTVSTVHPWLGKTPWEIIHNDDRRYSVVNDQHPKEIYVFDSYWAAVVQKNFCNNLDAPRPSNYAFLTAGTNGTTYQMVTGSSQSYGTHFQFTFKNGTTVKFSDQNVLSLAGRVMLRLMGMTITVTTPWWTQARREFTSWLTRKLSKFWHGDMGVRPFGSSKKH